MTKKLPIPNNVRNLYNDLSQKKISGLFGVSQVTVSNWLRTPKMLEDKRIRTSIHNRKRRHGKRGVSHYQEQLIKQKGLCGICKSCMKNPHQDHDHGCCPRVEDSRGKSRSTTCGKCLRGLLCSRCNVKLGHTEEILFGVIIPTKFKWFLSAQKYLHYWRKRINEGS